MKVFIFAACALFAAACTNGDDSEGDDDPGGPVPSRITIRTGEPPALIAFRNEASTQWTIPSATQPGEFVIEVTGPCRVVVACEDRTRSAVVTQFMQTPADDRLIDYPCVSSTSFPFHVTGEMRQEGEVFLGGFGVGESPAPWRFDLSARAGTFDFVALFGSLDAGFDQFAIRRDLVITGDLDLGTIDAAQEHAQPVVAARFTATNLDPAEELSATLRVDFGNTPVTADSFGQPADAWELNLLPDSALRPTDSQRADLLASVVVPGEPERVRYRSIGHKVGASNPTSFTLMEPLTSVALEPTRDRLVATWGSLPSFDDIYISRWSFSDDFSRLLFHDAFLSRSFSDAVGVASTALDFTDVPGLRAEWRHDPALQQLVWFEATARTSAGDSMASGVTEDLAPSPVARSVAAPRIDTQRAFSLAQRHRDLARRRVRAP